MPGGSKLFKIIKAGDKFDDAVTADYLNSITEELKRLSASVAFLRKQETTIHLGKTTIFHAEGDTRIVDIYVGKTKGSEVKSAKSILAYNRFADMEQGNWVIVKRINNGWEIMTGDPCASASAG